tara:strand:+ start:305 stop:676 length:372 start_codon:yes stop_codon:yes gene_type:complete
MKEVIKNKVLEKKWTFNEITNLKESVAILATEIYNAMRLMDKVMLIGDVKIQDKLIGQDFEQAIHITTIAILQGEVAEAIKEMLNTATIEFGGNKNENTESSLGGESHKKLTPNETKINNEEE